MRPKNTRSCGSSCVNPATALSNVCLASPVTSGAAGLPPRVCPFPENAAEAELTACFSMVLSSALWGLKGFRSSQRQKFSGDTRFVGPSHLVYFGTAFQKDKSGPED